MLSPNGLGPVESAILRALRSHGDDVVRSSDLLDAVEEGFAVTPASAYPVLLAMCRRWAFPLELVVPHGNMAQAGVEPADPRYTAVRLTDLGRRAADAERGVGPPLPIGLCAGTAHGGGRRPPFSAHRTVQALLELARTSHGDVDADAVHDLLGAPAYPAGCSVQGPIDTLLAGESVTLVLTASLARLDDVTLELSSVPEPWRPIEQWLPRDWPEIRGFRDESSDRGARFLVDLRRAEDAARVLRDLPKIWPLHMQVPAHLGAPWIDLGRAWLAGVPESIDIESHLVTLLDELGAADT